MVKGGLLIEDCEAGLEPIGRIERFTLINTQLQLGEWKQQGQAFAFRFPDVIFP
jgi:hypothetical protein